MAKRLMVLLLGVLLLAPLAGAVGQAPKATPVPREKFVSYQYSLDMFGMGWWKDEVRYSKAYVMLDTIDRSGRSGLVWLFIDDIAWTTGMEVFFDRSLLDAGVKVGDIVLMYCEGIEPYQRWGRENGRSIILETWNRARCHDYEILLKAEQEKIKKAVKDYVY